MRFIINGLMYDTDKMQKVADVEKWYKINHMFAKALYGTTEVGTTYKCELWKSKKENWLLTHKSGGKVLGEAIEEGEVKELLMMCAPEVYEIEFEKIPEA